MSTGKFAVPGFVWVAVGVVAMVIVVATLARVAAPAPRGGVTSGGDSALIKHLVDAAMADSARAAQDSSPCSKLIDATSGLVRLQCARAVAAASGMAVPGPHREANGPLASALAAAKQDAQTKLAK